SLMVALMVTLICTRCSAPPPEKPASYSERKVQDQFRSVEKYGERDPRFDKALSQLAHFYALDGRSLDAEMLYRRLLAIREQTFGPNNKAVAAVLNDLGGVVSDQGRHAEAEAIIKRALDITEKTAGADNPDTARCLASLAVVYERDGKLSEAAPLLERALSISQ